MAKDIFKKACKLGIKIELPNTKTTIDSRSGSKLNVYDTKGVVDVIGIWTIGKEKLNETYNNYKDKLFKLENRESLFDDDAIDTDKIKETKLILEILKVVAKDKKKEEEKAKARVEAKAKLEKLIKAKEKAEENELSKKDIKELEKEIAKMETIYKS